MQSAGANTETKKSSWARFGFHLKNFKNKITYKCNISNNGLFLHSVTVRKTVLEYGIYSLENIKIDSSEVLISLNKIGYVL